mgnify:CR=1 FL=1
MVDKDTVLRLIQSFPKKPFQILTNHDCFRVLPNYCNDLRKQYNIIMAEIANSKLLEFIISQLLNKRVSLGKADNSLYLDILNANYALS